MIFQQLFNSATLLIWILLGIMLVTFLIQAAYYLIIFSRIPRYHPQIHEPFNKGVSVIICARNEAENLAKNLPEFLKQDYPEFEIIVVNDCSTDNTEDILMDMKVTHPNFKYTSIQKDRKFTHGKKLAITIGIKAAKYEHLLFSDADCFPRSNKWINQMSRHFSIKNELVLGVANFERRKGLLNIIIRFENLFNSMQYISFTIKGNPVLGVNRNIAYTKELFFKHKGFASHLKVLSGEDDLFVNEASTKNNTSAEISSESIIMTSPPYNLSSWLKQKKLQLSTRKYYKYSSKIKLRLEIISRLLFYISSISLLCFYNSFPIALFGMIILLTIKMIVVKLVMNRLDERDLLLTSLLLDPLMLLIYGIIGLSNIIRPLEPKWN